MLNFFSPDVFHINGFPLIEFDRRPLDNNVIGGFVLRWTKELTMVQFLNTNMFCLNGYGIYGDSTLRRYREVTKDRVEARGALKRRLRPSLPKGVSLESWQLACQTAGHQFPLLVIRRERIKRDSCWIGKLVKTTRLSVTLRSIDPDATWSSLDRFLYKDITQIGFGGGYETMLHELAPPLSIDQKKAKSDR